MILGGIPYRIAECVNRIWQREFLPESPHAESWDGKAKHEPEATSGNPDYPVLP
jgi:hypothetical protein